MLHDLFFELKSWRSKYIAKTTGTTPRIINNRGDDVGLHRFGICSIGEQIKLIRYFSKYKPDVLVMECMAKSAVSMDIRA